MEKQYDEILEKMQERYGQGLANILKRMKDDPVVHVSLFLLMDRFLIYDLNWNTRTESILSIFIYYYCNAYPYITLSRLAYSTRAMGCSSRIYKHDL